MKEENIIIIYNLKNTVLNFILQARENDAKLTKWQKFE